jgi:hypothetical protein
MWLCPTLRSFSFASKTIRIRHIPEIATDPLDREWNGQRRRFHCSYVVPSSSLLRPLLGYRSGFFSNVGVSWNNYDIRRHKYHIHQRHLPNRIPTFAFPVLSMRFKWTIDLSNNSNEDNSPVAANDSHVDASPKANAENQQPNSDAPKQVSDFLTYRGWDVLETEVTIPVQREVAEWDPVLKKIVKKVRLVTEEETQKAALHALRAQTKNRITLDKKNPLHKSSRMCPVCRKAFQGHNQMTDHLIGREKCFNGLEDPSVRDKLLERQKNKISKMERRRLLRKAVNLQKAKEREARKQNRERLKKEAEQKRQISLKNSGDSVL